MVPALDLIVNPYAGPASRRVPREQRRAFAERILGESVDGLVRATETRAPTDGVAAARRAVAEGVARVVVWGGDGTVNAIAEAVAGSATCLGLVPGGSGNGLARALGVPLEMEAALRLAAVGPCRAIDLGRVNGRPFVNLAGLGLDAAVAHRFNLDRSARRGLHTYVRACLATLRRRTPARYRITVDADTWFDGEADLLVVANGEQYGHGARIAPGAQLDDGALDVTVIADVTIPRVLRHGARLFRGTIATVPGVQVSRGRVVHVEVTAQRDAVLAHRDGETDAVTGPLVFTVEPRHLQVVASAPP